MTGRTTPSGEPTLSPQEAALRARVRTAFDTARTPAPPEFATLWQRAARLARQASPPPARSPGRGALPFHLPAIAASVVVAALVATLFWQRSTPADGGRTAQAQLATDLQLAQALAAREPLRTPTDALLDITPDSLLRGGPALPAVDYPLLPEEKYL